MTYRILFLITIWLLTNLAHAQISPNRHSLVKSDAWVSCNASVNPNALRGVSHWIKYDLGNTYTLSNLHFWNYNNPSNLDQGLKDIVIDISDDGIVWQEVATFTLAQGDGSAFYEGQNGPNLNGVNSNFILITALTNYGGTCFGLGEFKADVSSPLAVDIVDIGLKCTNDEKPVVHWQVANEINIKHYQLEASKSGSDWQVVAQKDLPLLSTHANQYYLEDKTYESGMMYYRIKSIDSDGLKNFSNTIKGKCRDNLVIFEISPNPTASLLNIKTKSDKALIELERLVILDMNGKSLLQKNTFTSNQELKLDVSELPSGSYNLQIISKGEITTLPFIKIK